jgi:arylsulfatase A-like enzyme
MVGVRTERFKYIVYPDEKEGLDELFDLKADPHEIRNVVHDPAYGDVLNKMQSEILKLTREVAYPFSPKSPQR